MPCIMWHIVICCFLHSLFIADMFLITFTHKYDENQCQSIASTQSPILWLDKLMGNITKSIWNVLPSTLCSNLSLPLLFGSGCLQGLVCALPFFAVMHLWMMLPACNTHGGFFLIPAALLQAPADIKQYFLCQNKTSSSISPKCILTVPSPNNDTTVDTTFLGLSQESSTDPTY